MAPKKNDLKIYVLAISVAIFMGLMVFWMYKDSEKAERATKLNRTGVKPLQTDSGIVDQGKQKVTDVFKDIIHNPLQGSVPVKSHGNFASGNERSKGVPGINSVQQSSGNYYEDSK